MTHCYGLQHRIEHFTTLSLNNSLKRNQTGALTSDHPFCLPFPKGPESFIFYSSLLFFSRSSHLHPCRSCSLFENHSLNLRCILFVSSPPPPPQLSLSSAVPHAKLHPPQMHANTVPVAEEPIFQVISKETSVPQVSCVVLGWWEGLCNPELVVKSCLSKSEVMFFFFFAEQEPGQTFSIIKSRRKQ